MASLQKREKVMVVMAGTAALCFGINFFVCGKAKVPEPRVTRQENLQDDVPVSSQPADTKGTPAKRSERQPRTRKPKAKFAAWVRNPFAETWRLNEADVSQDSSALVLRGVIRKGNQAYVLIGDQILKEGEEFGDLKVIAIKPNYVVCRKGRKIIRLVIGDEQVTN